MSVFVCFIKLHMAWLCLRISSSPQRQPVTAFGTHSYTVRSNISAVSRIVSAVFASDAPYVDFPNPGHTLLSIFPSFGPMGMVGEACLPSNAYYPRTPDYPLCSGVHVCWSEHSDWSFVYGFMSLDYGFGTMTATTNYYKYSFFPVGCCTMEYIVFSYISHAADTDTVQCGSQVSDHLP